MSEVGFIEKSTLEAIGSALRNKEGTTDLIPVNTLADRIAALPSGVSKLPQVIDKTITEITAEDLAGATSIDNYAFAYCSSLTSITIPDSVTSIKMHSFKECKKLTSVTIPNSVTSIGYGAFDQCTSLTSVIIPNSVTSIENYAFSGCTSLTSVMIGSGIKSIKSYSLRIGSSTNKATITFLGITPPSLESYSLNANSLNKIIVPAGCGEAYKTATNWANLADYIEEATE